MSNYRMKSGLWHRKTGIHGRKIRALPPVKKVEPPQESGDKRIVMTVKTEGSRGRLPQKHKPFPVETW